MTKTTSVKITSDLVKELDDYANVAQLVEQSQSPVTRSLKLAAGFGAAASIGLMTFDQASADIIYSGPQNISLSLPDGTIYYPAVFANVSIDIDFDSQIDFFFNMSGFDDGYEGFLGPIGISWPSNGNVIKAFPRTYYGYDYYGRQSFFGVTKLPANFVVSDGRFSGGTTWYGGIKYSALFKHGFALYLDPELYMDWSLPGFVGIQFNSDQLGWMRIRIDRDSNGRYQTLTIIDWAYESIPGKPIRAGAIPEPGAGTTLGLLAMGAVGLRRVRKSQAK